MGPQRLTLQTPYRPLSNIATVTAIPAMRATTTKKVTKPPYAAGALRLLLWN